jgi:hypothetical protein
MTVGSLIIFVVVFSPVYLMLIAWFVGKPREIRTSLLGVGYLVTIMAGLWGGLALFALMLGVLFA